MVWGCSSAGEHFVDIEGVTGSIPVTPTSQVIEIVGFRWLFLCLDHSWITGNLGRLRDLPVIISKNRTKMTGSALELKRSTIGQT